MSENKETLVTVYKPFSEADYLVAKSILDDAGIFHLDKNVGIQDLFGAGRVGTGYSIITGPIEIQVKTEDYHRAAAMLSDLQNKL